MSRLKIPPLVNVSAIGLADAYAKLVNECMKNGALKKRFYGKPINTYDIVSLTEIKYPLSEPMLHPQFPTKELHLAEYEKQWERNYDWRKQGFEYNYMNRLIEYPVIGSVIGKLLKLLGYYHKSGQNEFIDQLKVIRENIAKRIEKGGECLVSNRDQAITWIPDRDMFVSEDQPCLQRIQFFVYEYPKIEYCGDDELGGVGGSVNVKGKIEFHVEWRSRDLFSAWNSNMIGLIKMLNKEIFEPNNLELVRVVDFNNSLHIYQSDWDDASKVKPITINPQLMR